MTIVIRDADGVTAQVIGIAMRNESNVLVDVIGASSRDADGHLQNWFGSLGDAPVGEPGSISLTPDSVSGFVNSSTPVAITTGSTTAAVIGATGMPVVAWELISGSGTWTILSPDAATTAFRCAAVLAGSVATATFRALVTVDGQSAYSGAVAASVENNGSL